MKFGGVKVTNSEVFFKQTLENAIFD